jgi:hypothetical protein
MGDDMVVCGFFKFVICGIGSSNMDGYGRATLRWSTAGRTLDDYGTLGRNVWERWSISHACGFHN